MKVFAGKFNEFLGALNNFNDLLINELMNSLKINE